MNYRLLRKSGLRVSDFCLGTMTFGNDWGWGAVKDEAQKMYSAFREAGGNFVDTANYYTKGRSEWPKFRQTSSAVDPEKARFAAIRLARSVKCHPKKSWKWAETTYP
jgi:predicted aldo/keto reductase-like oxidoreductase